MNLMNWLGKKILIKKSLFCKEICQVLPVLDSVDVGWDCNWLTEQVMDLFLLKLKLLQNWYKFRFGNFPCSRLILFHNFQNFILGVLPPFVDFFLQNQFLLLSHFFILLNKLFNLIAKFVNFNILALYNAAITQESFNGRFVQKERILAENRLNLFDVKFSVGPQDHLVLEKLKRIFKCFKFKGNCLSDKLKLIHFLVAVKAQVIV